MMTTFAFNFLDSILKAHNGSQNSECLNMISTVDCLSLAKKMMPMHLRNVKTDPMVTSAAYSTIEDIEQFGFTTSLTGESSGLVLA